MNQIWYRAKASYYQHAGMSQIHIGLTLKSKMAAAAILIRKNVNNTLDKDLCITFGGKTRHGHADMIT